MKGKGKARVVWPQWLGLMQRRRAWVLVEVAFLVMTGMPWEAEGWVALSKDGFAVTKDISLNEGTVVEGDMIVAGVVKSANYTWLGPQVDNYDCTPERLGALRWSIHGDFEGCDDTETWVPVKLCDRHCGFSPPPLPTLRTFDEGGTECTGRRCDLFCNVSKINYEYAPNITFDICAQLLRRQGTGPCMNVTTDDPALADLVPPLDPPGPGLPVPIFPVCEPIQAEECFDFSGREACQSLKRPYYPYTEAPAIQALASLFTINAENDEFTLGSGELVSGVNGRIVEVELDESRTRLDAIYMHMNNLSWDKRRLLWEWDPTTVAADQEANLADQEVITTLLTKLDSPFRTGTAFYDGLETSEDVFQTCEGHLNASVNTPTYDFLHVFYNTTGWEELLWSVDLNVSNVTRIDWDKERIFNIEEDEARPMCSGSFVFERPWYFYDRLKMPDLVASFTTGAYAPVDAPPGHPVYVNATLPTICSFVIEPPPGFVVRVEITDFGLDIGDSIVVRDGRTNVSKVPGTVVDGKGIPLVDALPWNNSVTYSFTAEANQTLPSNATVFGSYVNVPVSVDLMASGVGTGVSISYAFIPRTYFMQEQGDATLLQYALSVLEMQGANMALLGWNTAVEDETNARGRGPPGEIHLGEPTTAEKCFTCCYLGEEYDPAGEDVRERYAQSKRDGADTSTWDPFLHAVADVGGGGGVSSQMDTTVYTSEIPGLIQYMGYQPHHFLRTAYVSSLPPGSIKAPAGKPLGVQPQFGSDSSEDPPERPMVGHGLKSILLEPGGSLFDNATYGWGTGWGTGTRPGEGIHWRDGDGASDPWFPSWQILIPEGYTADLNYRWLFDLDHADLPLYSFVDADRRIVMANEMALSVPCGVHVNNTCGVDCEVEGTGLNMFQCMQNVETTRCFQPVVDQCNNDCGLTGIYHCTQSVSAKPQRIGSRIGSQATSTYLFSVGYMAKDNLTRSDDISRANYQGENVEGEEWANGPRSRGIGRGVIDNGLFFSFHDPLHPSEQEFATTIMGKDLPMTFTRNELFIIRHGALDMPIPRDCTHDKEECKFADPVTVVSEGKEWYNSTIPWWDVNEDKRVDFSELRSIVLANLPFLSIIFVEQMRSCRSEPDGSPCIGMNREADNLVLYFIRHYGKHPHNGRICKGVTILEAQTCVLSLADLRLMKTELEAYRRQTANSIARRPRFNMAKFKRLSSGGLEIASPDPTVEAVYNHRVNTLRISTNLQTTSEYLRLGSTRFLRQSSCYDLELVSCSSHVQLSGSYPVPPEEENVVLESNWTKTTTIHSVELDLCNVTICDVEVRIDNKTMSHLYFEGIIKEKNPMVFTRSDEGGSTMTLSVEGKRTSKFGRIVAERAKADPNLPHSKINERAVTLPDVSGRMVTTANLDTILSLPGLRKKSAFAPSRYERRNELRLDDGRTVPGTEYWYKTFQGSATATCGTFADGSEIPCPRLNVQYDVLENSGSEGDEIFVYTGKTILQGPSLGLALPDSTPLQPRMDCTTLKEEDGCTGELSDTNIINTFPFKFGSKKVPFCVSKSAPNSHQVVEFGTMDCDLTDDTSCPATGVCVEVSVWGGDVHGWKTFEEFRNLPGNPYLDQWLLPFDPLLAEDMAFTTCQDAEVLFESENANYLQVYYETSKAETLVQELVDLFEISPNVTAVLSRHRLALMYLDAQGVATITADGRTFDVQTALQSYQTGFDLQDHEQYSFWNPGAFERCFGCCYVNKEVETVLAVSDLPTPCPYVNITGVPEAAGIEGVYEYMATETSFRRPVWKQEPGVYYLYYLPYSCNSPPHCGDTRESAMTARGAGWVIGTSVGSDSFVAYKVLDAFNLTALALEANPAALGAGRYDPGGSSEVWRLYDAAPIRFENETKVWFNPVGLQVQCSDLAPYRNATTAIYFDDPIQHQKVSFPDASGIILNTGNLHEINRTGVQVSPILGLTSEQQRFSTSTRIKFGVGWQSVNITQSNNQIAYDVSWRNFTYCSVPTEICEIQNPSSPTGCDFPLQASALQHCAFPEGIAVGSEAVDGIVIPKKDDEECTFLYLTHDWFKGEGEFELEAGLSDLCLFPDKGQFPKGIDVNDVGQLFADLYALPNLNYWGIGDPADVCPSEPGMFDENGPTSNCMEYMQAGCKQACLRYRTCTGARWYAAVGNDPPKCFLHVPQERCSDSPLSGVEEDAEYLDFVKLSGGWQKSKLLKHAEATGQDFLQLALSSNILFEDLPLEDFEVEQVDDQENYCQIRLGSLCQFPDQYSYSDPFQILFNISTKVRYRICRSQGNAAMLGSSRTMASAVLAEDFPIDPIFPLEIRVANASSLAQAAAVRIGNVPFNVLNVSKPGVNESITIVQMSTIKMLPESLQGETVQEVDGGSFNVTVSRQHSIAAGIYSLENISNTVNAIVQTDHIYASYDVALEVREPVEGLCGELAHGSSHAVRDLHCAPASRYFQIGSKAKQDSHFLSLDEHTKVLPASSILETLGISFPNTSYVFGRPGRASIPASVQHHDIMEGAGFVSSGYGRQSGFGLGGQPGWTGFVPPDADLEPTPYILWCNDREGFQCFGECDCEAVVTLTSSSVLGATKTQRGDDVRSNTLAVPSSADGILLSTGNLEDVKVESSAMSGLRIDALKEHSTRMAASFEGFLEFSSCNTRFASTDCSLAQRSSPSIDLGQSKTLSVHSYHLQSFWVALYNATKDQQVAANFRDTERLWPLLLNNPQFINRTFSSTQSQAGVDSAALACSEYCSDLKARQLQEAEEIRAKIVEGEANLKKTIGDMLQSSFKFSRQVDGCAPTPFTIDEHEDPYQACLDYPCTQSQCQMVSGEFACSYAYSGNVYNQDFEATRANWEPCARAVMLDWKVGYPSATMCTSQSPHSCDYRQLRYTSTDTGLQTIGPKAEKALEDIRNWDFYHVWVVVQEGEIEPDCVCAEMDGILLSEEDGASAVQNHICATQDVRYQVPVCEGNSTHMTLGVNGSFSTTLLEFQSKSGFTDYLTVPAATGVVLTTGNLHAVTKEAGSATSIHVLQESFFTEKVTVGTEGTPALSQGSRYDSDLTTVHGYPKHCEGGTVAGVFDLCVVPHLDLSVSDRSFTLETESNAKVALGAETALEGSEPEAKDLHISMPTWDGNLCNSFTRSDCNPRSPNNKAVFEGTVITEGNFADIAAMHPNLLETEGPTILRGSTTIGASFSCDAGMKDKYGYGYTQAGWAVHTAAQCTEAQNQVNWESGYVLRANLSECRMLCQKNESCGAVVTPTYLDRNVPDSEEKCVLLDVISTDCTVESNVFQDIHLLVRKAPYPWIHTEGDEGFFNHVCQSELTNLTHVGGTSIKLDGYLNGDLLWRHRAPFQWEQHMEAQCDDFEGFSPSLPGSQVLMGTLQECKELCEMSPTCGTIIRSREANICLLAPLSRERRTLSHRAKLNGVCKIVASNDTDLHIYQRDEHIRLSMEGASSSRVLTFADASGIVITTGNLYDIESIGLTGEDPVRIAHALRDKPMRDYDWKILEGTSTTSSMSGRETNFVVRYCELDQCLVYSGEQDPVKYAALVEEHLTAFQYTVKPGGNITGSGEGFDSFTTTVDVARGGSRTSGVCFGDCKGTLPCQRGTSSCHDRCPGYMYPRTGVDEDEPCSSGGAKFEVCGCANGEPIGNYGTSVCVLPSEDKAHGHGRFCRTRTSDGTEKAMYECCPDPLDEQNCGQCIEYPPIVPTGKKNRITFPEATGTVVTNGNVDELDLRKITLEGLSITGFIDFGIGVPGDSPGVWNSTPTTGGESGYRYDDQREMWRAHWDFDPSSSKIKGGLKMVTGYGSPLQRYTDDRISGTAVASNYTQLYAVQTTLLSEPYPQYQQRYCNNSVPYPYRDYVGQARQFAERENPDRCAYKREILLPDTSGLVLTAENLVDVPSTAIPFESLTLLGVESLFTVRGNMTFGFANSYSFDPHNNGGLEGVVAERQPQSKGKFYTQFNGDIGITFQSAGDQKPVPPSIRAIAKIDKYGEFHGPFPFGSPDAPDPEVERFATEGRFNDGGERLWQTDTVKLNMPQGGGVDTALRKYLRSGAPTLPISVSDESTIQGGLNGLSDHFGYRSGRPVLQQRSITKPSSKDSYDSVPSGTERQPGQALAGSTPINTSWCYQSFMALPIVDPSNSRPGAASLSLFMSYFVEAGFLIPTLLTNDELAGAAAAAFDRDLESYHSTATPCQILIDLGAGNESSVTSVRYSPRKGFEDQMLGARFQGSNQGASGPFIDIFAILDLPPTDLVFTTSSVVDSTRYRWLRFVGAAGTVCEISELEFHRGSFASPLSILQPGHISYMVDEEALFRRENVETAMLVKCAAWGLIPVHLDNNLQEIFLPEAAGGVITTGNLEEIQLSGGSFTSANIAGDAELKGSVRFGETGSTELIQINSILDGNSYFGFNGPVPEDAASSQLAVSTMPSDRMLFMPDVSGAIVIGELPGVVGQTAVLEEGGLDFNWDVTLGGEVTLGRLDKPSSLLFDSRFGNMDVLKFGGFAQGGGQLVVGVPDASGDGVVVLPDSSGTVLSGMSMPKVRENFTAIADTELKGEVRFQDADVEIGAKGSDDELGIHANILGFSSLLFDGSARKDGRTLLLSALDPESDMQITLPDISGTVVTSANFPNTFETLRVLGDFNAVDSAVIEGDTCRIGDSRIRSTVAIKAYIKGKIPLVFDGGVKEQHVGAPTTAFMMPRSSRNNVITFPDTSGTVITTGNLPSRAVSSGEYKLEAPSVTFSTPSVTLGRTLQSGTTGAFVFADSEPNSEQFRPDRDNQFVVRASGGVQFVTGFAKSGRPTGAILRSNSSAWSYLSDSSTKQHIRLVDTQELVQQFASQVPVSYWQYKGQNNQTHVGPMAQSLHKAFALGESQDRISTSDADGITFAAVQGLFRNIQRLQHAALDYRHSLQQHHATLEEQTQVLAKHEDMIRAQGLRLQKLWAIYRTRH